METDSKCLAVILLKLLLFGNICLGIDWPRIIAKEGQSVEVPCTTQGNPLAYFWKKGNFYNESETVASLVYGILHRSSERFEITEDGTLLIRDISSEDEGRYYCRTTSTENECHGVVTVYVKDRDKHSRIWIEECIPGTSCHLLFPLSTYQTLTCKATNMPPATKLVWINGSQEVADQKFLTKDMESEISNTINVVFENPSVLICFAVNELSRSEDIPEIITHVSLAAADESTAPIVWIVVVAVLGTILLFVFLGILFCFCVKKSPRNKDVEKTLKGKTEHGSDTEMNPLLKETKNEEKSTAKESSKTPTDQMSTPDMVFQKQETKAETKGAQESSLPQSLTGDKHVEEKQLEKSPTAVKHEEEKTVKEETKAETTTMEEISPKPQTQTQNENQLTEDKTQKQPQTKDENHLQEDKTQKQPQTQDGNQRKEVKTPKRTETKTEQPKGGTERPPQQESDTKTEHPNSFTGHSPLQRVETKTEQPKGGTESPPQQKVERTYEDPETMASSEKKTNSLTEKTISVEEQLPQQKATAERNQTEEKSPHQQVGNEFPSKDTVGKEGDIQVCFRMKLTPPVQRWKDFENVSYVTEKQALESVSELVALMQNAIDGCKSSLMINLKTDDSKQNDKTLKPVVKKLYDLFNSKHKERKIEIECKRIHFVRHTSQQHGEEHIPQSPKRPPPPPPPTPTEYEQPQHQGKDFTELAKSNKTPAPPSPTAGSQATNQSKDSASGITKAKKERAPPPPGQTSSKEATQDKNDASGNKTFKREAPPPPGQTSKREPPPPPPGQLSNMTKTPDKDSDDAKKRSKRDPPPPPPPPKKMLESSEQDIRSKVQTLGIKLPPLPPRTPKSPHGTDAANTSYGVNSEESTQFYKCTIKESTKVTTKEAASFEKAWKSISKAMKAKHTPGPQNVVLYFSIYSNSKETTHPGMFAVFALWNVEELNKCLKCTDESGNHLLVDNFTSPEFKTLLLIDMLKDPMAEEGEREIVDQIKTLTK